MCWARMRRKCARAPPLPAAVLLARCALPPTCAPPRSCPHLPAVCPPACCRWVPFVCELAVMVVRSRDGSVASFPVVQVGGLLLCGHSCLAAWLPGRAPVPAQEQLGTLRSRFP